MTFMGQHIVKHIILIIMQLLKEKICSLFPFKLALYKIGRQKIDQTFIFLGVVAIYLKNYVLQNPPELSDEHFSPELVDFVARW